MSAPEEYRFCPACGTRLAVRDSFGRQRPVCPACGRVVFYDPKVAAAALVTRHGKVLLIQRGNVPEQGKWSLPAGFVDRGEDPRRAAERECLEETGLTVRAGDLFDVIYGAEHPAGADLVLVFSAEETAEEAMLRAEDDAQAAAFFGPEEIPPLAFQATRQAIERWKNSGSGILARPKGAASHPER